MCLSFESVRFTLVCVCGSNSKAPEPLDWRGFITLTTQTTSTGSMVLLAGDCLLIFNRGVGVIYPRLTNLTLLVPLSFTVKVGAINKISHKPRSDNGSINQAGLGLAVN